MAEIPGGPFVNMATFCQQVLQEKDDTITAVRIVDRVTASRESGLGVPIRLWSVVSLHPGDVRGAHTLRLRPTTPIGEHPEPMSMPVFFPDGEHSIQVTVNMTVFVEHEGTTLFDVYMDEQFLTRIPLHVRLTPPANTNDGE